MAIKAVAVLDIGNANSTIYDTAGTLTLKSKLDSGEHWRDALRAYRIAADSSYFSLRQTSGADSSGANFNPVLTDCYASFRFRIAIMPTGNCRIGEVRAATVVIAQIGVNSAGRLIVYDATNNVVATGTQVLSADRWYHIEWRVVPATTGVSQVWIEGILDIDYSSGGSPFGTSGVASTRWGRTQADANGGTYDFTGVIVSTTKVGVWFSARVPLVGNGSYAVDAFTSSVSSPNLYDDLGELPSSASLTAYMITSGVVADKRTFTIQDVESILGKNQIAMILHVEPRAYVLRDGGTDGAIKFRVREGGTDQDSGSIAVTSNRLIIRWPRVAPPTGGVWTIAKVQALEIGIVENSVNKSRIQTLDCHVIYTQAMMNGAVSRNLTLSGRRSVFG